MCHGYQRELCVTDGEAFVSLSHVLSLTSVTHPSPALAFFAKLSRLPPVSLTLIGLSVFSLSPLPAPKGPLVCLTRL